MYAFYKMQRTYKTGGHCLADNNIREEELVSFLNQCQINLIILEHECCKDIRISKSNCKID